MNPLTSASRFVAGFSRLAACLLCILVLINIAAPAQAAPTYNWIAVNGVWDSPGNWSSTIVPVDNAPVNIIFSDGTARNVTYNFKDKPVTLASLTVDLTGGLATANSMITMSSNFTLTTSIETLGKDGRGNFNQSNGNHIINGGGNSFFLGYNSTGVGTYTMTGGNLDVTGFEILGYLGTGNFIQSGGTHTVGTGYYFSLGSGGGTGNYNLSGSGLLTSSSSEYVGSNGVGVFTQTGGTNTVNVGSNLIIANTNSGTGTYTISGGTLTCNSNAYVGGNESSSGGTGTFTISGGTVSVAGTLKIWNTINTVLNISSGSLSVGLFDPTSNPARIHWTGGSITVSQLIVEPIRDLGNILSIGPTQTLTVTGDESMGGISQANVSGTVNQTGGTHTVAGTLDLGVFAGTGTFNLSGGTFSSGTSTIVGDHSVGIFIQTGGTSNFQNIFMGGNFTGTGTFTMNDPSGLATATVTGTTYVGLNSSGTLNIVKGTFNAGFLWVFNSTGMVNFSGGTLTFTGISSLPSRFNWTGGTLNLLEAYSYFDPADPLGTINLSPQKTLASTGTFANFITITMSGGNFGGSGAVVNYGLISGFGTFAGSGGLINNALMTQSGGQLNLYTNTTNNGTIQIATGSTVAIATGSLTNNGTITLNNGTLGGNQSVTNNPSGVISGSGAVTIFLTNAGLITLDSGTLQLPGFTNSGVVELAGASANIASTGTMINAATVEGHGKLSQATTNNGTIESTGGTLIVANTLTNPLSGTLRTGLSAKLLITGTFAANAGLISLVGGTFDTNNQPLSNTGQISGYGVLATGGLTNNGTIIFTDGSTTISGPVTNAATRTITIKNQPALFTGAVVNNGIIKTTSTIATFTGGYSGTGSLISDPSVNIFQNNVSIGLGGSMSGGSGDQFIFNSGGFTNAGTFTNAGLLQSTDPVSNSGTFTQTGPQSWSATTFTNTGTATFGSNTGSPAAPNLSIINSGPLTFSAAQNLAALTLNGNTATLTAGTIQTNALSIAGSPTSPSARLDLKSNALVINYTTPVAGQALLTTTYKQIISARGKKNGSGVSDYSGNGITSGTASTNNHLAGFNKFCIGAINNADLAAIGLNPAYTTFNGQTGISVNSILARYTYSGDINLDGKINIDDYNYIDSGFGGLLSAFSGQIIGDFNNDGLVNIDDYNIIDTGFGFQGAPLGDGGLAALPSIVSPVPEPATLSTLLLPGLCALTRRRNARSSRRQ